MRKVLLLVILLVPAPAAAAPVVLSVDGDRVLVELGADDGVGEGATLELLHEVVAQDPVTKETLRDTFPLGTLTVTRAGDHVAEATPDAAIAGRVQVGDAVRLMSGSRTFVDPWVVRARATHEAPVVIGETSTDPAVVRADAERAVVDAGQVREIWQATLGRAIEERVILWRDFLAGHADNRYAPAIEQEIASLEAQAKALTDARTAPTAERDVVLADALAAVDDGARGTGPLIAASVTHARAGEPVELAFAIRDPDAAARGWLYARTTGADAYQRLELAADGDAYLRGTVPAAMVAAPGVEWYVEVAPAAGAPAPAIGSSTAPSRIAVTDVREPPPALPDRSRVTLSLDYVDFDGGMNAGFDQYSQAEIDFMYRFLHPVYAFRLGFGTLDGWGGPKDVIDDAPANDCRDATGTFQCRRVAFTYGYAETEFRIRPTVALMIRPQVGRLTVSSTDGTTPSECLDGDLADGCSVGKGFGLRGRLRLGEETGTNLVLGLGVTSNVGTLFEAAYTWAATPAVPVVLAVQVTYFPVPRDFGVRILADVGYRRWSWVYPSVRASYQARDVDHAGFSGGLALNFDW